MSLKEEIGIIEEEEEMRDVADLELVREQETRDKIAGLYHRIDVIVEYIDNQTKEETATEEYKIRAKELELRALELDLRIKKRVELLEDQGNEKGNSEYVKGYEDGVKAISEKRGSSLKEKTAEEKEEEGATGLGRRVGDV